MNKEKIMKIKKTVVAHKCGCLANYWIMAKNNLKATFISNKENTPCADCGKLYSHYYDVFGYFGG